MPWYAFDAVDDALDATRNFLFPFTWGRWLRLAIIVFFLGGGGGSFSNFTNIPSSVPSDGGTTPPPTTGGQLPTIGESLGSIPPLVYVVIAVILLIVVGLVLVSAVMPFVFVDALRTNDVRIRGPFKRRFGKGMRLLGFQIGLSLLLALPFVLLGAGVVVGAVDPTVFTSLGVGGLLVGVALLAVGAVVVGLFFGFTNQFVVPVMIATDSGVIASWRQFWSTLREQWKQFVVYLFVRFVLQLGVGIGAAIVTLVLGGIILVVALLVGFVVSGAVGGLNAAFSSTAGLVALAVLGVLALLAFLAVTLPVQILVQSYFTAYELSVLGAANEEFALLPERPDGGNNGDDSAAESDDGGDGSDGDDGDGDDGDDGRSTGGDGRDSTDNDFSWGDESTTA